MRRITGVSVSEDPTLNVRISGLCEDDDGIGATQRYPTYLIGKVDYFPDFPPTGRALWR